MQFLKYVQPCSFANFEQIIAYPRRVCEEEVVSTPHIGLKLHNVYYRTTWQMFTTELYIEKLLAADGTVLPLILLI